MRPLKFMGKFLWILIAVGIVAVLSYPYETTVVPTWRVRVLDEERNPLGRVRVTEYWSDASVERDDHHAESITDDGGYVTFPTRTIRASLIRRGIVPLINRLNVHGVDVGPHAYLIVSRVVSRDMNSRTANSDYFPGKPLPEEIVLRRLE